jgi:gliding motility associated protien GldN
MRRNLKHITILIFLIGLSINSFSQSNLLNADNPNDIGFQESSQIDEGVLQYGYVDDKDVMFSKMLWETIDLSQKVNFPYLYPIEFNAVGDERRPLLYFIKEAIDGGDLTPSMIFNDGNFNKIKSKEEMKNLWKMQNPLDPGTESIQNIPSFIDEELVAERTIEGKPIFPYKYTDSNTGSADEFTIEDFKGLYNKWYNGGDGSFDGQGNLLSIEEADDYTIIATEMVKKLWIEDVHFEWINFKYEDLVQWKIKGLWYFDKIQSELKYRLIGIAPVAKPLGSTQMQNPNQGRSSSNNEEICYDTDGFKVNCDGSEGVVTERIGGNNSVNSANNNEAEAKNSQNQPRPLFWIYYPHLRDILTHARPKLASDGKASRVPVVFSERNSSVRKTFDELLNSRRFHTLVDKEENVYEDRPLNKTFKNNAFMRLLESERIKEKIRNLEHDMWSW